MTPWLIRAVDWDDPGGEQLRTAQQREVNAVFYPDYDDTEPGPKPTASDMLVFYVAFVGDTAVACGGLRQLGHAHGEVKRMYVDPAYRGRGLSGEILRTLEADAVGRGWTRLLLETGDRMTPAQRFYEREGYARIAPYGHYVDSPLSVCYEKVLAA
ncbi:GNAT family N-acetyltransferase [Lysinimonas soli]|uniref:GNAT family N-acetyltransferase n=1 Tax=Lysinimonas soli TaxID=1074233 RepID=A0ABW0NSE9_9MICO